MARYTTEPFSKSSPVSKTGQAQVFSLEYLGFFKVGLENN